MAWMVAALVRGAVLVFGVLGAVGIVFLDYLIAYALAVGLYYFWGIPPWLGTIALGTAFLLILGNSLAEYRKRQNFIWWHSPLIVLSSILSLGNVFSRHEGR